MIEGLKLARHVKVTKIVLLSDSRSVVNLINGEYEVKVSQMIKYLSSVRNLIRSFLQVQVGLISSDDNTKACALS